MNLALNKKPIFFVIPVLVIVGIVVAFLIIRGNLKAPAGLFSKAPRVELKTTYKNPFNKDTQYVNPFDKYKNPFVTNR